MVQQHVDRCLSCLSCMTTCPSGVDYMHLVDHARAHIEATGRRSFKDRAIRRLLAAVAALSQPLPPGAARPRGWRGRSRGCSRRLGAQGGDGDAATGAHRPAARRAAMQRSRHCRDHGRAAQARDPARRLRPAGAAARDQRRHHPSARPPRRRRRGGAERRLLRRARASSGPRGGRRRHGQAQRRCLVAADGEGRAHRCRGDQRVGLRHHRQGLRPHAQVRGRRTPSGPPRSPA